MTSPRMRSDITQIAGLPRLELHVLWTMYQGERLSIKCYVMLFKTLFALVFSLERGLDGFQIVDATFRRSSSALIGTQNPSIVACLGQLMRRSVLSLGPPMVMDGMPTAVEGPLLDPPRTPYGWKFGPLKRLDQLIWGKRGGRNLQQPSPLFMRTTHTYVDINYGGKENLGSGNSCSRWPPISRGHVKETLSHDKKLLKEYHGILLLQAKGNRIRFRFGLFQRHKCH